MYTSIIQNMNWSTILNKEIGKCTILNYTIIIVLKNAIALYVYFIYRFQVSFKAIWSVKMNVKSLKNILIVNHNFVVTIGLPYCYLPFKVIFRTNYFHEILWLTSHVCWFVCTKTKVTTITSEWQSSYNQNNFIILMKFNRNNVGIEDNFQVSSFTAFRLNNRMSTNMSLQVVSALWQIRP